MPTFTAQQLINRAAALADMKDGFISPQTWLDWLNDERQSLDLFLTQSSWVSPQVQTQTMSSASPTYIPLTSEVTAIIGVWEVNGSNRYRRLKFQDVIANMQQDAAIGATTGPAIYFSTTPLTPSAPTDAVVITFFPRPLSGTYLVKYVPQSTIIVTVTDTLVYPLRFERRIILGMALQALIAEEAETTKIEKLIQKEDARIERACWDRILGSTSKVRNVDDVERGWTNQMEYPPPSAWVWV